MSERNVYRKFFHKSRRSQSIKGKRTPRVLLFCFIVIVIVRYCIITYLRYCKEDVFFSRNIGIELRNGRVRLSNRPRCCWSEKLPFPYGFKYEYLQNFCRNKIVIIVNHVRRTNYVCVQGMPIRTLIDLKRLRTACVYTYIPI